MAGSSCETLLLHCSGAGAHPRQLQFESKESPYRSHGHAVRAWIRTMRLRWTTVRRTDSRLSGLQPAAQRQKAETARQLVVTLLLRRGNRAAGCQTLRWPVRCSPSTSWPQYSRSAARFRQVLCMRFLLIRIVLSWLVNKLYSIALHITAVRSAQLVCLTIGDEQQKFCTSKASLWRCAALNLGQRVPNRSLSADDLS